MSTIDPRTKTAQRRARGFAVSGWLLLAAYVALWMLAGASIAVVMQPFTLIGTQAGLSDEYGITAAIASFVIVLLGAAGCWVGYFLSKPLGYAQINDVVRRFLPTAVAFAAVGLGLFLCSVLFTPLPSSQGSLRLFALVPFWLPILLIVIGVLVLLVPFLRDRSRTLIKTTRTRVTCLITEVEHTGISRGGGEGSLGDPIVKVTARFTDREGTERWVTKRTALYRSGRPTVGTKMSLYYDTQRPSNTRRMLLDFPDMYRT